jgi:hypothetical protein
MKRTLIGIALVAVCLYGGAWAVVASMKQRYTPRPWPENLGTLDDASKRYRDAETNAAAETLTKLLPAVDIKSIKEPLADYYRAELERNGDQVQPPPANVAAFLAQHDAQMNAVRDHVLTAGPSWVEHFERGHDAPIPNLLSIMSASKLFTGRALAKAASRDAASWDDLHAVWLLDRELLERPELISQLVGLAGTRMANAAAAKMPLPVPAWFGELQAFDYRHRFAASYQAEAWMIRHAPTHMTERPFFDACALDAAEEMRVWTNDLAGANRCDLSAARPISIASWNLLAKVAMPSLSGAWQRFARFQAELEATEKILAMRRGETPSAKTACSDGSWTVSLASLKFSRDIAVPAPGIKYPLAYSR